MDDPLFIWTAKHILKEPVDFYGFAVNWYGATRQMSNVTKNPPLACYFIALAGKFFGFGEVPLHTAFIVAAAAAAAGVYYLGRMLCSQPIAAALATVLAPGFLVSSTNMMCDTMMLAFWVWAVYFWIKGMKEKSGSNLFFAAVLTAVCALTKYFGMSLLVLLFVYSAVRERKVGRWVLFLLIPVIILAGYQLLTYVVYGRGLLSDAASYAPRIGWKGNVRLFWKLLTGLSFTGGCILTVLFYIPLLYSRRFIIVLGLLVILVMFILNFVEKIGEFSVYDSDGIKWGFAIQFGLMIAAGTGILGLAITDFWKHRDADSLLLLLWMSGTFIFASLINWTINARSILPMIPAAGILLVRRLDHRGTGENRTGVWRILWPVVPAAVIAMSVCWADYTLADSTRIAAKTIHEIFANETGKIWFQGHWGFQYYMEAAGGEAFNFKNPHASPRDIIVVPTNNTNLQPMPEELFMKDKLLEFDLLRWAGTMNYPLGAGFYADIWGPLPFAIGEVEPERYMTFIVRKEGI
jgi:4-amino-4-deoxy-L-arabinose transferase-like glycosyltransferase